MDELDKFIKQEAESINLVGITDSISDEYLKQICEDYYELKLKKMRQHDVSISVCDSEWHESNIMHYGECTACGLNVDDV